MPDLGPKGSREPVLQGRDVVRGACVKLPVVRLEQVYWRKAGAAGRPLA